MSVDMYLDQSQSQSASTEAMVSKQLEAYDRLDQAIQNFSSSGDELQGAAYDSARELVSSSLATLVRGGRLLAEKVREAVAKFPEEYSAQVAPESLRESELREDIAMLTSQIDQAHEMLIQIGTSKLSDDNKKAAQTQQNGIIDNLEAAKQQLEEKLEKLLTFHAISPNLFSDIEALDAAIKTGAAQIQNSWDAGQGKFKLMDTQEWVGTINDQQFIHDYEVKRPDGISDEDWKEYVHTLKEQAASLQEDGWTSDAVKDGYIATVNVSYDPRRELSINAQLTEFFNDAHIVGSSMFVSMLEKAYSKDDKDNQQKTLTMLYKVLGAEIDENDFLQLNNMKITDEDKVGKYSFTKNIEDAVSFDNTMATIVQNAYPKGLPTNVKEGSQEFLLAQETHQFRYYLDKKNNDALRASYPDEKNDLERIKAYNRDNSQNKFAGEKARYHNKYQGNPNDYKKHIEKYGENVKYVTSGSNGFHTEFIVDKNNNLVSQWNAYEIDETGRVNSDPNKVYTEEQQVQLVDGNSVNYAESSDKGDYHDELDSDPVGKYDPKIREKISDGWKNPKTSTRYKDYFDRDESEKRANERLKE